MPSLRSRLDQPTRRPLPLRLCALLRALGAQRPPHPPAGSSHAGGHCAPPGRTWPGRDLGVREPYPGETALSWSEIHCAIATGQIEEEGACAST